MATVIVLHGGPGAGKGTQAKRIVEKTGATHVATGDMFRQNLANRTPLGILAKSYMDAGQLVPDVVTIDMLRARLQVVENGLILLDGFPRNVPQAKALWKLLDKTGIELGGVIYLRVSEETLAQRLLARGEGRTDDTPEAITTRLKVYQAQTAELIPYFDERALLHIVDGERGIDEVENDIRQALENILQFA